MKLPLETRCSLAPAVVLDREDGSGETIGAGSAPVQIVRWSRESCASPRRSVYESDQSVLSMVA